MSGVELLIRGVLAGLAIAVPVGPVNVLCVSRTIAKGWKSGLVSGAGAAAADTVYGAIAGFSITFVIAFLIREKFWIRLFGGILLCGLGVLYYRKPPQSLRRHRRDQTGHSDYVSAFLMTLANPTTVLSFLAVLATLGIGQRSPRWMTAMLVAGVFSGSMMWWLVLVAIVNRFRDRFNDRAMLWMNRIAGIAIGAFGVVMILMRG